MFFELVDGAYVYLINTHGFHGRDDINVGLLLVNAAALGVVYPWQSSFR